MAKRNYPNDYFAWYNDDDRLAIVCLDSAGSYFSISSYSNKTDCEANGGTWNVAGNVSREKYDTYQESDVTAGLRITYHSKYEELTALTDDLTSQAGLNSALHNSVLCYVKARLFEDMGDFEKSAYFRKMYEQKVAKHRGRRSGIRSLSVPRL